uniref:dihydrolipoyl dehydrogenase n=1 Tax=uncultured Psychrobacter sp. TaxID=259303 RepID=UPI002606C48B|nr:dihydrolipoyl dehydrogenase [uncultured Psychrobacter sp.]
MNQSSENLTDKSSKQSFDSVTRSVSIAVIGAGTAGQNAFRQARKSIKDIVIINEGYWTTTCVSVGCMPSKLLIAAAERAHDAKYSEEFGIHSEVTINGKQVMARVQAERSHFESYIEKQVESWPDDKKIDGRAYINKEGLIEVNDERIKADRIIVATGSKPFVPDGWSDKLGETLLTSDSVFELSDLPDSMAVVGAGAVGLELAHAFARLGVAVTLFNRTTRIGGLKDDEVNDKAISCLSEEMSFYLGSQIHEVATKVDDSGRRVATIDYTDKDDKPGSWQGDYVLVATGRRNNIDKLGVENLGVELDDKNRPKDVSKKTGQVGELAVHIVGDANMHLPFLHVASDEGYSAGNQVCGNEHKAYIRPPAAPLAILFTNPQLLMVGKSIPEIEEDPDLEYVIGKVSFDNQGRSRIMGVNCGLLHIYGCKKTDRVLGATMVGPDAEYIGHILATAITNDITVKQLLDAPFYHPTILEGLRTALRDVQHQMDIPYQTLDTQTSNS